MNKLNLGQQPNPGQLDFIRSLLENQARINPLQMQPDVGNVVAKIPELIQSVLQSVAGISTLKSSGNTPPAAMNLLNMAKNLPVNTNPMAPANPDLTAQTLKGGEKHGLP
ncbi:hypothetical protein CLV97_11243 [Planifilum fimeticola]|jgi:hypothetical protein|uniref:Uncharacterized protein n=1 Tax=Planifilum fimeticola TaxID=201975 RepID=A0A2T0LEL5_9BACL|nr:hypothetical protein [Planifilum fimeticola]PRX40565.1 hypothetical protein CLV97_11243 [Planifilum fimeticola]